MALTAEDIKKATDEAQKYITEIDQLADQYNIKVKDLKGNDAGDLLKASGAGLASGAALGAAVGAVVGAACPICAPFAIAGGAIIGALAAFFSKFRFGPSVEQIRLAAEFDKLNGTLHAILLTVPQPYRAEMTRALLDGMRASPGPIPFCLGGGEAGVEGGGCVNTSMTGLRNAAAGVDQQVKDMLAKAQADAATVARRRAARRIALGAGALAAVGYGIYHFGGRRGR